MSIRDKFGVILNGDIWCGILSAALTVLFWSGFIAAILIFLGIVAKIVWMGWNIIF